MQSQAATVTAYLRELPPERRTLLEAVRKVIRANLDRGIEEVMNYGMIGYVIPHKIYPAGYHCDPAKPFPYGGLASQKNYCSLYLFPVYGEEENWFREEWKKGGKKLDMGKCCIRFKKLEDLDLEVLARALRRFTIAHSLQVYERALGARAKAKSVSKNGKSAAKSQRQTKVAAGEKLQVKSVQAKAVGKGDQRPSKQLSRPTQVDKKLPGKKPSGPKRSGSASSQNRVTSKRKQNRRG